MINEAPKVGALTRPQLQMPTAFLLTVIFPQKVHVYLACWEISIFLTCLRREAPYLGGISKKSNPSAHFG